MSTSSTSVAIIGSGVAGLSAAWAIARAMPRARIVIYEASRHPGGHAHTIVDPSTGTAVDVGFIVWSKERYPRFACLLDELGIASTASEMAFSVSATDGSFEFGSRSLSAAFAQRRSLLRPSHYRRLMQFSRFLSGAQRDLRAGSTRGLTLGEYVERTALGPEVVRQLVEPLASSLWSMAPDHVGAFPAETFLRFLEHHGMLNPARSPRWMTIRGGARRYVDALLAQIDVELRLSCPVRSVSRRPTSIVVSSLEGDRRFDNVVMATHPDTSLALLSDPTELETKTLGAMKFSPNRVVLHTDTSFLPRAPAARASWNYSIQSDRSRVSLTYWMNALQNLPASRSYLVTLNPQRAIPTAHTIAAEEMRHPRLDFAATRAQAALPAIQGQRKTFFCGAWTGYCFHEDGVRSGFSTAARLLMRESARNRKLS